ncbi:hypothetical protein [Streptomyces sp. NBC_01565]|uniref:hypothetical protein n=1 Tax=unclassified Streptomyces TaxID=2593676 RepID=UPI00224FBA63|nr:hypothetical protein [Streptomyces sp. NBC_01565]MCX4546876.1 hypothetical protein [Streptomyces sp. NBC_01565]
MALEVLGAMLAERDGVWDRPDGDWLPGPATEAQRHANSLYRLGSLALRRNELGVAARWLAAATRQQHPGAVLRLAAASSRITSPTSDWCVRNLVGWAAVLGHSDEIRLAPLLSDPGAKVETGDWDDPEFAPEIWLALNPDPPSAGIRNARDLPHGEGP